MGIIACKFGGTSTAGTDMLKRIYDIIRRNPDRRYVVLSAPGRGGGREKVTDMLCEAWRTGNAERVVRRFEAIARGLGVRIDIEGVIAPALRISEAATLSRGEYLCARLFSAYTGIPFVDAAEVIRFDENRRIDRGATRAALRDMARRHSHAVIPGFYGSDPAGSLVTFPRNGSDITGALVAAGVGASLYENWTDVPGLMTGDPAEHPGAKVIPRISYADMRALCVSGTQVLHPDSLDAVEQAGIPTQIKCTMAPDLPGTTVHV